MREMWMSFKKYLYIFFLCLAGRMNSAQTVRVLSVKEPAIWVQHLEEGKIDQRTIVLIKWPHSILKDHLEHVGKKNIAEVIRLENETERLVTVSFWEQPPLSAASEEGRLSFKVGGLQAFYYPASSAFFVFPLYSAYGETKEGIPAVAGDSGSYENFPYLFNFVMRSLIERHYLPDGDMVCVGTVPLFFNKFATCGSPFSLTCFCLEPLEEGKPSPVQHFVTTVLGSPPRPTAKARVLQSSRDFLEEGKGAQFPGILHRLATLHESVQTGEVRKFPFSEGSLDS